jgi:hypothetical protein
MRMAGEKTPAGRVTEFVTGNLYTCPEIDSMVRICVAAGSGRDRVLVSLDDGKFRNALDRGYSPQATYYDVTNQYELTKV